MLCLVLIRPITHKIWLYSELNWEACVVRLGIGSFMAGSHIMVLSQTDGVGNHLQVHWLGAIWLEKGDWRLSGVQYYFLSHLLRVCIWIWPLNWSVSQV